MITKDKGQEYLTKLFSMMREREYITLNDKNTHFRSTEMRLLTQVLFAKYEGKRVISAQLAKMLGLTRSAVSMVVHNLESRGIIVRVPDSMDKKIAYVEISDSVYEAYKDDLEKACAFIAQLVEEFGEEKFEKMYSLFTEFALLMRSKLDWSEANR